MLFDLYGELLTDHQREIYGLLVNDDMSLSELAEQYGISRQGVHDLIRRCDRQLEGYEEKLHLLEEWMLLTDGTKIPLENVKNIESPLFCDGV